MKLTKFMATLFAMALCVSLLAGCKEGEKSTKMIFNLEISTSMAYYVNPVIKITDENGVVVEENLRGTNMSVGSVEFVSGDTKEGCRTWSYTYLRDGWDHNVKCEISLQLRDGANLDNKDKELLGADISYIVQPFKGNTTSTLVIDAEADPWTNVVCEPGKAKELIGQFIDKSFSIDLAVDANGQVKFN